MSDALSLEAYSAWRQTRLGSITERLEVDLIMELTGDPTDWRVLDVGCGDGTYAIAAAERGAIVSAVDRSSAMVEAAQQRAGSRGFNVDFRLGDATALPFPDADFDVVTAVTILCFLHEAAPAAFDEIARVTAPQGKVVVGELGRWSPWAATRRVRGWLGSKTWRHAEFRTKTDLTQLATAAGLAVEQVRGAIYYPAIASAARLLAPLDRFPARNTTVGAVFLAVAARKP